MTRKLHNTVSALLASTALLVVSLMAASPIVPTPATSVAAGLDQVPVAALAAGVATPVLPLTDDARAGHSGPSAAPRRRHRQSVAMPYFSFAPQG